MFQRLGYFWMGMCTVRHGLYWNLHTTELFDVDTIGLLRTSVILTSRQFQRLPLNKHTTRMVRNTLHLLCVHESDYIYARKYGVKQCWLGMSSFDNRLKKIAKPMETKQRAKKFRQDQHLIIRQAQLYFTHVTDRVSAIYGHLTHCVTWFQFFLQSRAQHVNGSNDIFWQKGVPFLR
jgi:hypothetical protein